MRRLLFTAFLSVAFGSCTPAAFARQAKPAAPPVTRTPAPGLMDDPILQQRVTLNLKDANINQAVEELGKAAKVSLVVERSVTLALRPVTLSINGAKLRDVMDQLGHLYGYRWRRRNDVFLLTIVPQQQDREKFGEQAMRTLYEQVLTPEQRAKVDADGYLLGKDLTPGQQGILTGYLQEMFSMAMSANMNIGKVVLDRKNNSFSINTSDGKGDGGAKP